MNDLFTIKVLEKYSVNYYKCSLCEFIQTEEPYWLGEAYSSAITSLDIGLIYRNMLNKPFVETLIKYLFDYKQSFVDYGGGYGMFVRMMRDVGLDFYRQDIYCENLFAKHFDVQDLNDPSKKFEVLTAFEVFEHLVEPVQEFENMLALSDNIFFTTTIYPKNSDLKSWWYLIPETGQHVSLYSHESLRYLANKFKMNYLNYDNNYHLITKERIDEKKFKKIFHPNFIKSMSRKNNLKSLLDIDFNNIANIKM